MEENFDAEPRVYEVGYLLVSTLSTEEVPIVYGNLKELVLSLGGEMISDEMPKMISLAYPMLRVYQNKRDKFENAYFGWLKFFMDPAKTGELKKKLELDPNFIRFLLIKTVKENTLATKRFSRRDDRRKLPEKKEEGEALPINKEEIDKEIEAMVAEN